MHPNNADNIAEMTRASEEEIKIIRGFLADTVKEKAVS